MPAERFDRGAPLGRDHHTVREKMIQAVVERGSVGIERAHGDHRVLFLSEPWAIPWWARLIEVSPLGFAAARELRAFSVDDRRARAGASAE